MLANTKDLKYGLLTKEVISSKPLMVLPNLPRFVRQGDEVSISTQVINNSKEAVSGRVRIELFDPATDQPIICLSKSQRPFELQPDSIATVSWMIPVPKQISLLGVRILATLKREATGSSRSYRFFPINCSSRKVPRSICSRKERNKSVSPGTRRERHRSVSRWR